MANLDKAVKRYERYRPLKYVIIFFTVVIAIVVGSLLPYMFGGLVGATYERHQLDKLMRERLGAAQITDVLTDEILIVSYDYNSQQPRFWSKYYAKKIPYIYDIPLNLATASSSAAPTYFKPKSRVNHYGMQEYQIDGGVICNNPTLYAFKMATYLNHKKNVRILSLGTGSVPFDEFDRDMDKKAFISRSGEFMMNIDDHGAQGWIENYYKYNVKQPQNYVRVQCESDIPMDSTSTSDLDGM